jgi:hypothetical protein
MSEASENAGETIIGVSDRVGGGPMIAIFAGAGASYATNPDEYPTTLEFRKKLDERITSDPLFLNIDSHLKKIKGKEATNDIEEILWVLSELDGFVEKARDDRSTVGWFLRDPRIMRHLEQNVNFTPLVRHANELANEFDEFRGKINQQVYDFYSRTPTDEELNKAWVPLLQALSHPNLRLEVFTTNYDQIIEGALQVIRRLEADISISDGVAREVVNPYLDTPRWEVTFTENSTNLPRNGLLTKLHGSVNWSRRPGEPTIYCGAPAFVGDHEREVIIYPGHKGPSPDPPFDLFHDHFRRVVKAARAILFIGFAFRDDYINDILRNATPRETKLILINPSGKPDSFPLRGHNVKVIKKGFDEESVNEATDFILGLSRWRTKQD